VVDDVLERKNVHMESYGAEALPKGYEFAALLMLISACIAEIQKWYKSEMRQPIHAM